MVTRRRFILTGGAFTSVILAGCMTDNQMTTELDSNGESQQLSSPNQGKGDIFVEVFTDYSCNSCNVFQQTVYKYLKDNYIDGDEITYVHKDFPIPIDDWSVPTANAARKIQYEVGNEGFWEFKSEVNNPDFSPSVDTFRSLANEYNVPEDELLDSMKTGYFNPTLSVDYEYGREIEIPGTPAVLVDGDLIDYPMDSDMISKVIEQKIS